MKKILIRPIKGIVFLLNVYFFWLWMGLVVMFLGYDKTKELETKLWNWLMA